jgi:hypothetical protein
MAPVIIFEEEVTVLPPFIEYCASVPEYVSEAPPTGGLLDDNLRA